MEDFEKLSQQEKDRINRIRQRIKSLTEEIEQKKTNISSQIFNTLKQEVSSLPISPSIFSEVQNMLLETITKGYEAIIQEKEKIINNLQKEIETLINKYEELKITQEQQISKVSTISLEHDKTLLDMLKKMAELETENKNLLNQLQQLKQQNLEISKKTFLNSIEYIKSHFSLIVDIMTEMLRYFRTQIGTINEAVEIAKTELKDSPTARKLEVIQQEFTKIVQILRTTQEKLKLPEIHIQKLDLKSVVSTAISNLQTLISSKNIEVIEEFLPQEDTTIEADFQILLDILQEIIANAVESFMQPTGNKITISIKTQQNNTILSIEDNGVGIPEHLLPKIYKLFFTTKFEQGHYGIGLFKSFWLLKMFNAKIEVSSVFNRGTTVKLIFSRG